MVTDGARIIHVLEGFEKGTVTQIEADAYLKATCNITLEDAQRIAQGAENTQEELAYGKKAPLMLGIFIILILTIVYMIPGTPTGISIIDVKYETRENAVVENPTTTSIVATGTFYGEGTATLTFKTAKGTLLIGTVTSNAGISQRDGNGTIQQATPFTNLCEETCVVDPINGTVHTWISGTGHVEIISLSKDPKLENTPPQQLAMIPQQTITQETMLDLSKYFIDADNDYDNNHLTYSVTSTSLVNAVVIGTTLTLTPLANGTTTIMLYVSDEQQVISATVDVTAMLEHIEE